MRVLIVEKDDVIKTVYQSELHQQNITVDLASDGKEAYDLAQKNKPDLIVTELILPKMNGFELLEKIKNDKKLKDVKVIISSLLAQKSDIDEAITLGAHKYLQKDLFSQKQVVEEIIKQLME